MFLSFTKQTHSAAALSDGWLDGDLVVCPYHAYKFDGDGKLRYIPGVDEVRGRDEMRRRGTARHGMAWHGVRLRVWGDRPMHGRRERKQGDPGLVPTRTHSHTIHSPHAKRTNPQNLLAKNKRTARTVWYKTAEQGGLVYIFPDAMRAGAIEQHVKPFLIPEEVDPAFRVVQGTAEIRADANLVGGWIGWCVGV